PRGLNGTLAVETDHSTAPTQLSRVTGFTGTQRVVMAQALRGTTGHGWSVHTQRVSSDMSGRCTHWGQFRTRVVSAHSRHSLGHRWSVRTTGTVQDTDGRCTQRGQFRTQVVSAHTAET
ncbi:unnamed protein product, partial [Staurois parvus]